MSAAVSEKLAGIVTAIEGLTVVELVELVDALKAKLGLSDADLQGGGGVVMAAPAAAAPAEEAPTEFNVTIKTDGGNKIGAIKVVRALTNMGLADAKAFVEGLPKVIKEHVSKQEADEVKAKFAEIGAEVEIKGV